MYRAILPEGQMTCERYEHGTDGVELFTEDGDLLAFVPYPNLRALVNEDVSTDRDRPV